MSLALSLIGTVPKLALVIVTPGEELSVAPLHFLEVG